MNIAHIVCAYPPYYSGMGHVVLQTVRELATRGHDIDVITPLYHTTPGSAPGSFESPVQEQVDYARRYTPTIRYGNAARLPQLKTELDRFDLVHLHYPFFGTANLVRKWKARNPHKPLVITYHMDTRAPGWKGLFFTYYNRYWMPKILGSADLLLGSSEEYIEASDASPLCHASPEKWKFLPFGVDTDRFQPRTKPLDLFEDAGFDPATSTILFVGGMDRAHYFKGVSVLLRALYILKKANITVQTLLVGDGDLREKYQQERDAYGLTDHIVFLGRVDDDLLPAVYNAADMLVLPSTTAGEAFGMVLLEAFASGVPVIASDLPGVRRVAQGGGIVVPPHDHHALAQAIIQMCTEQSAGKEWAGLVRQRAMDQYAWPGLVDQLEGWYKSLVSIP